MNQTVRLGVVLLSTLGVFGIVANLAGQSAKQPALQESVSKPPVKAVQEAKGEETMELALSPDLRSVDPRQFLDPIPVGQKAPNFTATDARGRSVKLSDYHGKKNLVLIFYSGSFCSICGRQLANLQSHLTDFNKQDAEVLAISADDQTNARKVVGEYGLSFPVISDADKSLIKKFGVGNVSQEGIAWPASFVIDKQGIVRMSVADPQGKRLHSSDLLPVLSKITGKPAPALRYGE